MPTININDNVNNGHQNLLLQFFGKIFAEKALNLILLFTSIVAFFVTTSSFADVTNKKILLKKDRWTALSSLVNDKKICYTINYSYDSIGNANIDKSNKSYIDIDFVGKGVFKFTIHFAKTLQTNSIVFVNLDDQQFELKSYQDFAYFTNYQDEEKFISLLDSGQKIISRAIYSDESYSVENFNIYSFTQIKNTMLRACK